MVFLEIKVERSDRKYIMEFIQVCLFYECMNALICYVSTFCSHYCTSHFQFDHSWRLPWSYELCAFTCLVSGPPLQFNPSWLLLMSCLGTLLTLYTLNQLYLHSSMNRGLRNAQWLILKKKKKMYFVPFRGPGKGAINEIIQRCYLQVVPYIYSLSPYPLAWLLQVSSHRMRGFCL